MNLRTSTVFVAGRGLVAFAAICHGAQHTSKSNGVMLKNEYVTYRVSADGKNSAFLCNSTGKQYGAQPGKRPVVTLKKGGVEYQPTSCGYADERICVEFGEAGVTVVIKVVTKDRYFVLEVESVSDPQVEEVRLVNLAVASSKYVSVMSGVATDGEFAACLRALNLQIRGQIGEGPAVLAGTCYRKYGFAGAKIALVGCPHSELRDVLKEVV